MSILLFAFLLFFCVCFVLLLSTFSLCIHRVKSQSIGLHYVDPKNSSVLVCWLIDYILALQLENKEENTVHSTKHKFFSKLVQPEGDK